MPEFGKEQQSTRKQVDPRDHFSWSTPNLAIKARPTDPYVSPGGPDPNVSAFVDSMKNIEELTGGYLTLQKAHKKENAQRATVDARKPGAPETVQGDPQADIFNQGFGYQEAYHLTMGEDRGRQYQEELLQGLKDQNHFQNEANPDAAYKAFNEELYGKHFGAVQDNPQLMFGASAQVQEAVNRGALAMHEANTRTFKETFTAGANRVQQGLLSDYARGDHTAASAEHLRKVLADEWEWKVKPANLMTRDEYSRLVVSNIGTVALKLAEDPTMTTSEASAAALKLVDLFETPDAHTKLSYATMTDGEGKYKFRAEVDDFNQRLNATIAHREKQDRQAVKDRQDTEAKDLFVKVVLDPEMSYEQKQQAITSAKWLGADAVADLVSKAYTFHNEERHIQEDHHVINSLRERIEMAETKAGLAKLRKEVIRGYGASLNTATSRELQGRITSRIDHIESETRANRGQSLIETQEEKKMGYAALVGIVGREQMTDTDDSAGAQRVNIYGRMYFNRVKAGESPTEASKALITYFNETGGKTEANFLGTARYSSVEAIRADRDAGKLRPDEALLELKKLLAKKQGAAGKAAAAPAPREQPGVLSKVGGYLKETGANLRALHREKDDWRFPWEDE